VALPFLAVPACAQGGAPERVVVGSKNFEESRLLAEVFAQLLEARAGVRVERRLNLAGTQVCFEALRSGAIDLYPEYTGTGLVSLLGESPGLSPTAALNRVRSEFLRRFDLHWLAPLGFENSYEIAVPAALARAHGLRTLSDLVALAPRLTAAFGYEFVERPDGLPGLREVYGLRFREVRSFQQALKYQAAGRGEVDVLDVYTTDGRLLTHDLTVLEDDRGFFPPYEAAALVRGEMLGRLPQVGATLALLAGTFDEVTLRRLNQRLQEGGEEPAVVAREALSSLGLVATAAVAGETPGRAGGLGPFLRRRSGEIGRRTLEHLTLSGLALGLGILLAVPAGMLLERRRRWAEGLIRTVGVTQTVPSLALLAFMIPFLGVGWVPAVVALWIYSLFPILRNTYTGLRDAGPEAVDAARSLGMTETQVLRRVRLPLAAPVILAGVRTAAVLTVGTATLAAFIGAGGLGEPIVTGLQLADGRLVLAGAIPAAVLAVAVDLGLSWVERALTPRGIAGGK
jgi:osmoprotectant transport system permease protein